MTDTLIWTIVILAGLGLLLSLMLSLIAKKFKVKEDPRIDEIEKVMPGANCGGCGFAGCRAFADAAVKAPNLDNNFCPVGGNEVMKKVAAILGYEMADKAPQVAVVRCNGTCEKRPRTNVYDGVQSCRVKAALYSGDTGCSWLSGLRRLRQCLPVRSHQHGSRDRSACCGRQQVHRMRRVCEGLPQAYN